MTSKLTRERLQEIAEDGFLKHGESKELARMALAAMDSKPVIFYRQINPVNGMKTYWAELDPEEFRHLKQHTDENAEFMTLYRHAQPAPVVPDEIISELEQVRDWILNTLPVPTPLTIPNARRLTSVINVCRAAMLNGG